MSLFSFYFVCCDAFQIPSSIWNRYWPGSGNSLRYTQGAVSNPQSGFCPKPIFFRSARKAAGFDFGREMLAAVRGWGWNLQGFL